MAKSKAAFRAQVAAALELVPAEFRPYLDNLEIVIEDWPSDELLDELEIPLDEGLYGLYSGTALTERCGQDPQLPDRITLYRGPLQEDFPDPEELRREVVITVLHEIAHHFGIDEERLEELGLD